MDRGEGGVGDAGGIGPREKGNNRSGGGNKEILPGDNKGGRPIGDTGGGHKKSAKNH
jgi:hypothetical protein